VIGAFGRYIVSSPNCLKGITVSEITKGLRPIWVEAGAMLVGCRLAGLSALEADYADIDVRAQSGVGIEQVTEPRAKQRDQKHNGVETVTAPCDRNVIITRVDKATGGSGRPFHPRRDPTTKPREACRPPAGS
jgi:hypothetical protein